MIATGQSSQAAFSLSRSSRRLDRNFVQLDVARAVETAVRRVPVAEVAACPFSDWSDAGITLVSKLESFPDTINLEWFRHNVRLSPTAVRRLRDAIKRRRRVDQGFLPWWPAEAQLDASNAFWLVARAAADPADCERLWSVMEGECKADPFAAIWKARAAHKEFGSPYDNQGYFFAFVLARGVDAFKKAFSDYMSGNKELPEESVEMLEWCVRRHPECYDLYEADAARAAARAKSAGPVAASEGADPTAAAEVAETPVTEPLSLAEELLAVSEAERAALEAERDVLYDDLNDLNMRYAALQRELAAVRAGHDPRRAVEAARGETLPTTLSELLAWIETALPPSVHVTPRAWRGIKKAVSVDFERVAKGLKFLRDTYVPYRTDQGVTSEQYAAAQVEAGFDECACFSSASSLDAFPEYSIAWNGGTVQLDRHLKRGYSNNPRDMLRIYFMWDRATKTVVVGSMPGHLSNWTF
jgi:hypothetical protein